MTILELQEQVRRLQKQIAQAKKEMKEHPRFDGFSLDIIGTDNACRINK